MPTARAGARTGHGSRTLKGAITTDDGASILVTLTGYGDPRAKPNGRVLVSVVHTADHSYGWLNNVLGVACGEVRGGREIVLDVAEVVWEPLPDTI